MKISTRVHRLSRHLCLAAASDIRFPLGSFALSVFPGTGRRGGGSGSQV